MVEVHIGIDDTDSPRMGCTTYIAALLVERFRGLGTSFIDYPNLVRLNPNVPWKTRGNGALCLRIHCREDILDPIKETLIDTVAENSDLEYDGTDPGIVLLFHEVPEDVEKFAKNAIQGLVTMNEALNLIKSSNGEAFGFKMGRGIIGGLAAIGERFEGDHTYEFIAYRTPDNCGTRRRIDPKCVVEMDEKTRPLTFNNIDPETGRVLITPRGPDPILYGIRGERAETVKSAGLAIRSEEPIERWIVFKTNHGTDAHLRRVLSIAEVKPYHPVILQGTVVGRPQVIPGGHVIFRMQDGSGVVDCAAYDPTGSLKDVVKELRQGDLVEAMGGVRPSSPANPITINLEKMRVIEVARQIVLQNPLCPNCGRRMKSMGKEKGFRCEKCGFRGSHLRKMTLEVERSLKPGLYMTPPRSQRHLTKPFSRYGLEKKLAKKCSFDSIPCVLFSSS